MPKPKGKTLLSLVTLALLTYGTFALLLYVSQPRLLFFPTRSIEASPQQAGLIYEDVSLTTDDGLRLGAWYVPALQARGVILFCHGNGGNISHRLDSLLLFHGLGYACLIFDYRGYGTSDGSPDEAGTYLDSQAAWRYLVSEKGFAKEQIILFGRSLGGAVAAHLAGQVEPAGLILESVFTSVPDMAADLYPLLPVRLLCRYKYDTRKALARVRCPVLVVHSPDDEIIPFAHGRALLQAANPPKTFLEIHGDHNSGFLQSKEGYAQGLADFFKTVREKSL